MLPIHMQRIHHLALGFVALACLAGRGRCSPDGIELVVSRYAEDLSWLALAPFGSFKRVTVYDKNDRGDKSAGNPPPYARVRR